MFCLGADTQPDHRGDEQSGAWVGVFVAERSFTGAGAAGGLGRQGVFLCSAERTPGGFRPRFCGYATPGFLHEPDDFLSVPDVESGGKPPLELTWRAILQTAPVFPPSKSGQPP